MVPHGCTPAGPDSLAGAAPTKEPSREGKVSRRLNQSPSGAPRKTVFEGCLVPQRYLGDSLKRECCPGVQGRKRRMQRFGLGRALLQPSRSVSRFWRCGSRRQRTFESGERPAARAVWPSPRCLDKRAPFCQGCLAFSAAPRRASIKERLSTRAIWHSPQRPAGREKKKRPFGRAVRHGLGLDLN